MTNSGAITNDDGEEQPTLMVSSKWALKDQELQRGGTAFVVIDEDSIQSHDASSD